MKKYQFKLDKVLEVRQIEEEQAQNLLMQAREKAREIEEDINRLEEVQSDLYEHLREEEGWSLEENMIYRNYINQNRNKIKKSKQWLFSQKEEVKLYRETFMEKRKNREVLEKLKDKDYHRYNKEMLLKEQKVLDEMGLRMQRLGG